LTEFSLETNARGDGVKAFTIRLNLFPDASFLATLKAAPKPSDESEAWSGIVDNDPNSDATFIIRRGAERDGEVVRRRPVIVGTVRTATRAFEIEPLPGTEYLVVREMDDDKFPECATGPEEAPDISKESVKEEDRVEVDDGSVIDVIVFYTPKARIGAGGTNAIKAKIDLAISQTNSALERSGITTRVRLKYKGVLNYHESGSLKTILQRLRSTDDDYMTSVHEFRDTFKADLVSLIVEKDSKCGIAGLMTSLSPNFKTRAFSVCARSCATSNYTFAHELAHNMGCCHDASNHSGSKIYPFAHGWRFVANGRVYRTIMSYRPGQRIKNFSNPTKTYGGVMTGKANRADNARVIRNTARTVANFRQED
jgi:peptidyl-Asp metalloendopeptidase